jgi:hypothetical protein
MARAGFLLILFLPWIVILKRMDDNYFSLIRLTSLDRIAASASLPCQSVKRADFSQWGSHGKYNFFRDFGEFRQAGVVH